MIHDVHADTASIYVATPADLNLRARRSYVYTCLGPPIASVCVVCAGVRGVRGVRRCAWCAPVCAVCVVSLEIPLFTVAIPCTLWHPPGSLAGFHFG